MDAREMSEGIYDIMEGVVHLHALQGDPGGDPGSGVNFKNDTFESLNYWSTEEDECDCGQSDAEDDFGEPFPKMNSGDSAYTQYWIRWTDHMEDLGFPAGRHLQGCVLHRPLFKHYTTGLEMTWYKRVGRGTESNFDMKALDFYRDVVVDCLESLKRDADER